MDPTRQLLHDLRSPLSAINLVLGKSTPLNIDERRVLRLAARRIQDMISSFSLSPKLVDVSLVLDEIVAEKTIQLQNGQVALQVHLGTSGENGKSHSDRPLTRIDELGFRRALSNLLDNSIESIAGEGEISVHLWQDHLGVHLTIQDTGSGIPTSVIHRLGSWGNTAGKPGGQGLGLAHAKQVICAADGELSIRRLEKGTLVSVLMPGHSLDSNGDEPRSSFF